MTGQSLNLSCFPKFYVSPALRLRSRFTTSLDNSHATLGLEHQLLAMVKINFMLKSKTATNASYLGFKRNTQEKVLDGRGRGKFLIT